MCLVFSRQIKQLCINRNCQNKTSLRTQFVVLNSNTVKLGNFHEKKITKLLSLKMKTLFFKLLSARNKLANNPQQ